MSKAPTLTKRDQRRMRRDPDGTVAQWNRDERAFAFMVADHEAHEYVRMSEYWSQWTLEDSDGVNQRNRDHVKDSRHWEDVQCAKADVPVGHYLTHPDGTTEWVEPDTSTDDAKRERTAKAVQSNTKGTSAMTGAERVRLSRWRKRATESGWLCPTHGATRHSDYEDCTLDCAATHLSERQAATGRKSARHTL